MTSQILFASRLFGVIVYGFSIYWQQVNINPLMSPVWGKLKYLTYWDLCLQAGFFTVLFLTQHVVKVRSKSLTKFVDLIFYSLAFPISVIVAGTFWGIYAVDRELIFPVVIEKYYPVWLNHSTHTLVVALTAIELVLGGHRVPSPKHGLSILFGFIVTYLLCLLYIYAVHDHWVYPIFRVLNWTERILFFAVSLAFNLIAYYTGVLIAKSQGLSEITVKTGKQQQKSKKHK